MNHWIGNLQGDSDTLEKFPLPKNRCGISIPTIFVHVHGLTINITRRGRRNADWKYVFLERRRKRGRQRCYPTTEKNRHTYALHRQTCFRQTYVSLFKSLFFCLFLSHAHLGYPFKFSRSIPRLGPTILKRSWGFWFYVVGLLLPLLDVGMVKDHCHRWAYRIVNPSLFGFVEVERFKVRLWLARLLSKYSKIFHLSNMDW